MVRIRLKELPASSPTRLGIATRAGSTVPTIESTAPTVKNKLHPPFDAIGFWSLWGKGLRGHPCLANVLTQVVTESRQIYLSALESIRASGWLVIYPLRMTHHHWICVKKKNVKESFSSLPWSTNAVRSSLWELLPDYLVSHSITWTQLLTSYLYSYSTVYFVLRRFTLENCFGTTLGLPFTPPGAPKVNQKCPLSNFQD